VISPVPMMPIPMDPMICWLVSVMMIYDIAAFS
jgi:hypothetical protein